MDFNITLADVLTPAGFVATAGVVTGLVEIFKHIISGLSGYEPGLAAVLAAAFVVAAFVDAHTYNLGAGFVAILAWYGITRISMGFHDDVTQAPNSLTGPALNTQVAEGSSSDVPPQG